MVSGVAIEGFDLVATIFCVLWETVVSGVKEDKIIVEGGVEEDDDEGEGDVMKRGGLGVVVEDDPPLLYISWPEVARQS